MLFFKCLMGYNEMVELGKRLSFETYCITKQADDYFHFGVIEETAHSKLIDVLSAETLEHMEYLDRDEFLKRVKKLLQQERTDHDFIGNIDLLSKV